MGNEGKRLVKLVVFKKGGESGEVAVNPDLVTHVRSAAGPFTDVWFGSHMVSVEGSFRSVVAALSAEGSTEAPGSEKNFRIMR
jgi:hypothetical protein